MISKSELLMGRDQLYPQEYTEEISNNLDRLLIPLNQIREAYGIPMHVDSGWRPPQINEATSNSASHSKHLVGLAVDIQDVDGKLRNWVIQNLSLMQKVGLWMEDFRWTNSWVHFQCIPPASGHRIYVPSTAPAKAPNAWSGHYDPIFD